MKICVVNPGFHMGGAERINIELANLLAENHEISILDFTGINDYYYKIDSKVNSHNKVPKISIKSKIIRKLMKYNFKITKKPFNPIIIYKAQVDTMIEIFCQNNYDCVILSQGELTACISYIKSKLPRLKIIAWQHNSYDVYINNYYKDILRYYVNGLENADRVVCLTENDADWFKEHNQNSYCIYNPLTIEKPVISNVINKNIIFVGRLSIEQKGIDFLIELAKNIDSEWKILVAGDGNDRNKVKKMIAESSLEEKVILKGNLDSKDLRDFYSKGSIFISTSRWEGFGLVITEAMASGLPVICFNNLGPREILLNGEYGLLVNKFNIDDFLNKLKKLISDDELRKYWKEKSLERAEAFKKESIVKEWEIQLQNLI